VRAFLALPIPDLIKVYLQKTIATMARGMDGVKWVSENGQHVTLKFFGDIGADRAFEFREALLGIEERHEPVLVTLGEVDAFPTRKGARVIIVTLKKGIDNIRMIFNDIEDNLLGLDVETESREFTPHITLGRRRMAVPLLEREIVQVEQKTFSLDTLVLYRSTLTREGAIYDPVWEIRLVGGKRT
jgi:RNA 2',3'-cyclic 3'-phosphodiesterase